jgi:hypothetical protein
MIVQEHVFHRDDLIPDVSYNNEDPDESIREYIGKRKDLKLGHGDHVRNIYFPEQLMIVDKESRTTTDKNYLIGFRCYWLHE